MRRTTSKSYELSLGDSIFKAKSIFFILFSIITLVIFDAVGSFIYQTIQGHSWGLKNRKEFHRRAKIIWPASTKYNQALPKSLKPIKAIWGNRRYTMSTNSLGFRDTSPRQIGLTSRNPRTVFIGDSFTEGVGVEYHQTFVGQLEQALPFKNIEVFNAGTVASSPIHYRKRIKDLLEGGFQFDHLIVILDLSDVHEAAQFSLNRLGHIIDKKGGHEKNFNQSDRKNIVPYPQNSIVFSTLKRQLHKTTTPPISHLKAVTNHPFALRATDSLWLSNQGKNGLQLMTKHMNDLKEILDDHQVNLTVVVFPWPDQILKGQIDTPYNIFWRNWTKTNSVTYYDLFPSFISSSTEENIKTINSCFIKKDVHFNEEGHKRFSNAFLSQYQMTSQ